MFFYQFFTLTFLAFGIVLTWLVSGLAEWHFSGWSIVAIGSLAGLCVGLSLAAFHSYLIDVIAAFLSRLREAPAGRGRNERTPPAAPPVPMRTEIRGE